MNNNKVIASLIRNGVRIELVQGDITEERVDAIVNAANSHLRHGGGVAGAIVKKGGYIIQKESDALAPVPVGSAVITGAGSLPARYVIHAVGPIWGEGDEERKLRSAVSSALKLAREKRFSSISLPAISSGIFGYPKEENAAVIVSEIKNFADNDPGTLNLIRICIIDEGTVKYFRPHFIDE